MKRILHTLLLALFTLTSLTGTTAAYAAGKPGKGSTQKKSLKQQGPAEVLTEQEPSRAIPATEVVREKKQSTGTSSDDPTDKGKKPIKIGPPVERQLKKAGRKVFDLRTLPATRPKQRERKERQGPTVEPGLIEPGMNVSADPGFDALKTPSIMAISPPPIITFDGLDRENWGAGSPPDTNGDVGPTYYIQSVNTSVGVYRKSDGFREAAFTFDTLMSQGNFGNQCDNQNFGDPVVLYDTFEDRWILTDFAFTLDGGGNVNPAEAFQCFAVSINGDPLTGGWNFYSTQTTDGLNDYPKLGIWPDGLYMTANMFAFASAGGFQEARVWAFNKAQMYAGAPTAQIVTFDVAGGDFTVVPSNARLQTGTPPAGRPNLFLSTSLYLNALSVYKFHVDWNSISLSTFTGPDVPVAATSWPNANVAGVPQSGTGQLLDSLALRAMVQNQYTNIGGVESLWITHTVRRGNTTGFAAPRWYQVNVTGGTVNLTIPQAATWDPDAANVMHRWMGSLALDRGGNMALGYSTSNATTFPSIKYAGRLATDPVNTFSYTEQTLFAGTASQTGSNRWGDYSSMTLDPNGCTFWFTTQYANPASQLFNQRWLTRIGSFKYPECTPVGAGGTVSGTVTATAGGAPIVGATVQLGARSATTNGSGVYSFLNIPAGTYPTITASSPGFVTGSASNIVVTDGGTTTQNFSLAAAPTAACLLDTTQADFQLGVPTNVNLSVSLGDVKLDNPLVIDQQNTNLIGSGFSFTTAWHAQTFTSAITGPVVRVDLNLFSLDCGAVTMPNVTLSIRAATGNVPSGADLGSATIAGFCNGGGGYFTANFATPVALVAGTQYALVWRTTLTNPSTSPNPRYVSTVSNADPYAGGRRATSTTAGVTWTGAAGTANNDHGFMIYLDNGYAVAGNLVSSVKGANPAAGLTPTWSSLSWTATTPANTTLQFQAASSNSATGPFAFVGPDGTAATFFTTSPASISQFYNKKFVQYKAYLATSSNLVTPTVNDVTLCFANVDCTTATAPLTPTPAQVCPSSVGNTASGPAGATAYSWSISNGSIQGSITSQSVSYTAGAAGTVGLTLNITTASGCQVSNTVNVPIGVPATPTVTPGGPTTFCQGGSVTLTSSSATSNQWYDGLTLLAGQTNATYVATASGNYNVVVSAVGGCSSAPSSSTNVTVNPTPATPTITPSGPTSFCQGGSVTLTSSSASGNQWYDGATLLAGQTNQTYIATASGSYNVVVTASGCPSSPSLNTAVSVTPIPPAPTVTPSGSTTFCTGGSVTLTSSSASGNQWYDGPTLLPGATNQAFVATASGNYNVVVTTPLSLRKGNVSTSAVAPTGCSSPPSASTTVTVNPVPATPTVTPSGSTTFCAGGSVTLTSSSASGNQWLLNGNPISGATNQAYIAGASGSYTVTVTATGCTSAPSTAETVTVNPTPATPTITPGGPTTFCTGGSVTLTSSSASGNQWFLDGNPIGGATNQQYVAAAAGGYTVVVTSGCPSAASASTAVAVNSTPATPTITPGGPTTFCAGGSVTLTSSSASGNQWYDGVTLLAGQTGNTFNAAASGNYNVVVTVSGCSSAPSSSVAVTVNPTPATPTITPSGPTTFCSGGSVTLTASSASGIQWYDGLTLLAGEINQTYLATTSGNYNVVATTSGCSSTPSASTTVTVNPIPATPTITPGGPTTFCAGGSVTLTSSSASGNQWYLDGNPIGGATAQQYIATLQGGYTVVATAKGCPSAASSSTAVTVNPSPATPTITPGGPTTFCTGGSVTLTSSSASGNQWFLNGNPIGGATAQQYVATATGGYTVIVTASGCPSAASASTAVTVNPIPATPTITPGGPTTFCAGGSVTLTSSGATGNQWSLNGNPIGGATAQQYVAAASGSYTVVVTQSGCSSSPSSATVVTVNPIPATPTITPSGPTSFCTGGSVTLNSSSASANQWFLNGNPIAGQTSQALVVSTAGDYAVIVTTSGCASSPSATTTVTINPIPSATITAPGSVVSGATGSASVPSAGVGATYVWGITNGTFVGATTGSSVNFTAGAAGSLGLTVTVTSQAGCPNIGNATVTVTAAPPPVTVTQVDPAFGRTSGNAPTTIKGTGFLPGAAVTFDGLPATSVIVVNSTTITVRTPAHAAGAVSVAVTNTNASTGALNNGYTYILRQFDPNNDNAVDPSDIFYLVNYLFRSGPVPAGPAGLLSGDANGDNLVDPADIFYVVNYLFLSGPQPAALGPQVSTNANRRLSGNVSLGRAVVRDGRTFIPVTVVMARDSEEAQAFSLKVRVTGDASVAGIRRAGAAKNVQPAFEITRATSDGGAYLVLFADGKAFADAAVVAEIELAHGGGAARVDIDPDMTMLSSGGTLQATVAGRTLSVQGVTVGHATERPTAREKN